MPHRPLGHNKPIPYSGVVIPSAESIDEWVAGEEASPHCSPYVGSITLIDFTEMSAPDRETLRQRLEDAIRASTTAALTHGLAVPAGLLTVGLVWAG